jgi:hypothetical protein
MTDLDVVKTVSTEEMHGRICAIRRVEHLPLHAVIVPDSFHGWIKRLS